MSLLAKGIVTTGICAITLACGTSNEGNSSSVLADSNNPSLSIPNPQAILVEDNTDFALELMKEASKSKDANVMLSPYSISSALGMTYAGAKGDTEKEMQRTMKFSVSKSITNVGFGMLNRSLVAEKGTDGYQLSIANRLWGEQTFEDKFKDEFLTITEREFGAGLKALDFKGNPEASRIEINEWVESKTNDRITDLIPKGAIDKTMTLVLTNAVYFNGDWAKKFDENMTRDEKFYVSEDKAVDTPMMHKTSNYKVMNNVDLDAKILELPYASETPEKSTSMVILLPNKKVGLDNMKSKLDADKIRLIQDQLVTAAPMRVNLTLPKWKTETSVEMSDLLKELGMKSAFDPVNADFSGIAKLNANQTMYISKVLHKTFINVKEGGTEAAGATAVLMPVRTSTSIPPLALNFRADHPFLYMIQDNATGSILFMGQLDEL